MPKSDVAEVSAIGAGLYDYTALLYSKQDLLDLTAFLGWPIRQTSNDPMN